MYLLVYLTSVWVQPLNETLLPKLRTVVDEINAEFHNEQKLIELLQIHRSSDGDRTSDVKIQRLEPLMFQLLCKQFQVTDVPACVLLDAKGQALMKESLQCLEVTMSCWKVFEEILKEKSVPAAAWNALYPLWQANVTAVRSTISKVLEVDDIALVNMRQEALELFETGDFLSAASRFVNVLMRCPTCTKSSFNLAVILHTIGTWKGWKDI
ncbi:hypothetical protein DD238_003398 [Peronospora effusa]|uniref:Uncharacterized protein n=1 Tax=Peronospora effusa TaxID=542832 RepID=A0A3M6VI97_9STRA|nr:hypothetical protein DD238_003398 [Peronospora effusa]